MASVIATPSTTVNVAGAPAQRGRPSTTGRVFLTYVATAAFTPTAPIVCHSVDDATAAGVPDDIAAYVGIALAQGAPDVVVWKTAAADLDPITDVTLTEWQTGLAMFSKDFGNGQVIIPGVTATNAVQALAAHATAMHRTAIYDVDIDDDSTDISSKWDALAALTGPKQGFLAAPWVEMPGVAGTVDVPGSVIAAGLIGRTDAIVGNAGSNPTNDQGRGAGVVTGALGPKVAFTDAQAATLWGKGVDLFRVVNGQTTFTYFVSLAVDDAVFGNAKNGRLANQLVWEVRDVISAFQGRNVDDKGHLFAEVGSAVGGYLLGLENTGAINDYAVICDSTNNTQATIAAGELHVTVTVYVPGVAWAITVNIAISL